MSTCMDQPLTCVTGGTGMLGELVASHTKVVIYPAYAIHCKSL